jgi:hypothetical protein
VGPASPTMVSISLAVEEAPVKTNQKSSPAKGCSSKGFFG